MSKKNENIRKHDSARLSCSKRRTAFGFATIQKDEASKTHTNVHEMSESLTNSSIKSKIQFLTFRSKNRQKIACGKTNEKKCFSWPLQFAATLPCMSQWCPQGENVVETFPKTGVHRFAQSIGMACMRNKIRTDPPNLQTVERFSAGISHLSRLHDSRSCSPATSRAQECPAAFLRPLKLPSRQCQTTRP